MFGLARSSIAYHIRQEPIALGIASCLATFVAWAEPPIATYIFPAGAQQGTTVEARIGGLYFHGKAQFHLDDPSITASSQINEIPTVYFESPLITRPESQRAEDYPKDHSATLRIPINTPLGLRTWHCETDQGSTPDQQFVIGALPEIIENEIEGRPIPTPVTLPITINGRIFPREDVDLWSFKAEAGEPITCQVRSHRLGYPLEAILDILDENDQPVPSSVANLGGDPELNFIAPQSGQYKVRITDANFSGLQNFVYRLTIRRGHRIIEYFPMGGQPGTQIKVNGVLSDGSRFESPIRLPEESGLVPVPIRKHIAFLPFYIVPKTATEFHGQIDSPGKVNRSKINGAKGEVLEMEVVAHALHSRLDSVLSVINAEKKVVGTNDDRSGTNPDSHLVITIPEDGTYEVQVQEKFESRGGRNFGYLLVIQRRQAEFQINTATRFLNVPRRSPADLKLKEPPPTPGLNVSLTRYGGFEGPVQLKVSGLPDNIEVTGTEIAAKSNGTSLKFLTQPNTPFVTSEVTITATGDATNQTPLTHSLDAPIRLSIVPKTPFKHVGYYRITNEQPAGSVLLRDYELQRFDGFDGPIRVSLADRSVRHLQGVHGPVVKVPAGANRFEYPIHFGTHMEMNRTCRMQLMLVGEVDGKTVSYTTANVNDQIIAVTAESLLSITPSKPTVSVTPGSEIEIPFNVGRNIVLSKSPVTVSARVPPHFAGVTAAKTTIPPGEHRGKLVVKLSADTKGPFNMPLPVKATATDHAGLAHAATGSIELVLESSPGQ